MKSMLSNCTSNKYESTKKFVNVLDLLIGHDDKNLYGLAAKEKIDQTIEDFPIVDDEGNQYNIFSSVQKFQKFGPGVYLMFKLLKHMMLMFSIISVLSLIQFMFLIKSPYYQGYSSIVRINMLRLTIASLQPEDYNVYIGFDIFITLIIIGFLVYWSQKLRSFADKCNQNNSLPSYLTVQLTSVDKNFSEQSLRNYLTENEKIVPHEIYTGRNYGKFLKHYKKLTDTAIDLRILKELYQNQVEQQRKKSGAKPIIKKFLELKKRFCSIKGQKFNERKYKPKQVFIVLKNHQERQKLLSQSTNILTRLTKKKIENQIDYQFKACQVEPEAIAWQNVGLSYINYMTRALIVFFILCICTCFGVIIIFMLQVLETASIGDAYYFHDKHLQGQNIIQRRYLTQQLICSSSSTDEPCKLEADYGKLALLIIITPFVVFVCKKSFMALLSHFVHFRKYPSEISRIKSQTITLSIFYFIVIAVLHLVLYLKVDSNGISLYQLLHPIIAKIFNFTNYNPASIHLYSDYTLDWYKEATFFIVIIGVTSFNIANGVKFLIHLVSYKLQKMKAKKQKTIYGVKKYLKGVNLHMQNVYASMIALIYFTFIYFCPIPITICFALVNLAFLFYVTKWTLIRYGQKPLRMGHSINRTVTNMLLIGVVFHCFMTPIFLGANGIDKNNLNYDFNQNKQQIQHQHLGLIDRFKKFPQYTSIGILMMVYILFRKPFTVHVIPFLKQKFAKRNKKGQIQQPQYKQYFGLYPSYSMHNCQKYSQILKNVYLLNRVEAKRVTCPLPKTLKKFENIPEFQDDVPMRAFDQILNINRTYLDKEKQNHLYEEVEEISRIAQSSFVKNQSQIIEDKASDDRIAANFGIPDQIEQEQVYAEEKEGQEQQEGKQ